MLLATLQVTLSCILLVYVPGHSELTSTIGGASFSLAQTSGNLAAVVVRFLVGTPGGTAPKLTFVTGSAALFSVASEGLQRGKAFDRLCTAKDFSKVCLCGLLVASSPYQAPLLGVLLVFLGGLRGSRKCCVAVTPWGSLRPWVNSLD